MQLLLQVCDVDILILDLVLLHDQQALHALVLFLESNDMITATLVLFEHFTEVFIGFLGVLLDLSLDQGRLRLIMLNPLLNQLSTRVQRADLASLGLVKPVVEVDERIVLHLAVAAVAGSILSLVLQRKLDSVLRAVFAHRDAALLAILVLFAEQVKIFDGAERVEAEGTLGVLGHDYLSLVVNQGQAVKALDGLKVGIFWPLRGLGCSRRCRGLVPPRGSRLPNYVLLTASTISVTQQRALAGSHVDHALILEHARLVLMCGCPHDHVAHVWLRGRHHHASMPLHDRAPLLFDGSGSDYRHG